MLKSQWWHNIIKNEIQSLHNYYRDTMIPDEIVINMSESKYYIMNQGQSQF